MQPTPAISVRPTLVVGWDGSAAARAALALAARLADGGRLVAVHAHPAEAPEVTTHWQELLREDAAERSAALLGQTASAVPEAEPIDLRSVGGPAAVALRQVADEVGADAIVVGSRGLAESAGLVGSVSATLLAEAGRPVLVVPARSA